MRRFMLAAAGSMLILAACTDQQAPTEPSAPQPDPLVSGCTVTRFPLVQASALIVKVFPNGRLRVEALARAGAIALLWNTCHASAAQRLAVDFVNWMTSNSRRLIGTQAQRNQLINLMLNSVGVPGTVPEGAPGDFGVGFFDPNSDDNTLVKTQSGTALVELEPGSFLEPTTIVISRLSDNFELSNFGGDQFPPYFDYNAINASGIHDLEGSRTAIVGFCLFPLPDAGEPPEGNEVSYPPESNRRIGHNPVEGATNFPFEILDPVDLEAEGLADELNCPTNLPPYTPDPGPIGFGGGLSGFANAAWHQAGSSLGSIARAIFLPQPLEATMLGTLPPPIGGRAPSLSPFGVVEFSEDRLSFTEDPGPSNQPFHYFKGVTIDTCGDGCYPAVQILGPDETPVGAGTNVTVSLIQTQGTGGVLGGTLTQPIHDFNSGTFRPGEAVFDDLTISAPGTYQLKFTAPGATPITSLEFPVYTMAFTWQPFAEAGHTFFDGDVLGQPLSGFDGPVVQVSIVDLTGSVISTATDVVQISMTDGFLSGTTSQQAVNGVASFTNLQVFRGEGGADLDGVSLEASTNYFGTNPVQATSTTFNVHGAALTLGFHTERGLTFDPVGQSLMVGSRDVLRWWQSGVFDGFPFGVWVYPAVQVLDASGSPQLDVPVGVSLVAVNESPGALGGTLTRSTVASGLTGLPAAFFDDLIIDLPGIYRLEFTTPGADPVQSGEFTVGLGPVSTPENFGSSDWSYKEISSFDAIPQSWWTITPTPATGWTVGTAPFGTSGSCDLPNPVTPWTQATTMLLRRDILINSNVASITLEIRVDGDVFAAVNGWGVDGGGVTGVTCGSPVVQFIIPASQTGVATAEAPLLPGQENKIFIRGVDDEIADGSQSYLDAKITVNALPPIN